MRACFSKARRSKSPRVAAGTSASSHAALETRRGLTFHGGMLRSIDRDLWVAEQPLGFYGLQVGARMTVLRRPSSGGLLVHSPIAPTPELRAEVDAHGPVELLVAPNRWHHLFIGAWMEAYPQARAFAAPGLERKRRDLAFSGVIDDAPGPWAPDLEHVWWRGAPVMNEVVFFHRPSRTLVLTDAAHNFASGRPWLTRTVFRALGGYGRFTPIRPDRWLTKDRAASRASLERILAWDFDRVIVAHGDVLESGGQAALRSAYGWLLGG